LNDSPLSIVYNVLQKYEEAPVPQERKPIATEKEVASYGKFV
jgi:hypothetical protein